MAKTFIFILLLISFFATAQKQQFGIYISENTNLQFRAKVLRNFGIKYGRDAVALDKPKSTTLLDSSYCTVLNVNAGKFATDTITYKTKLLALLKRFSKTPVIVIIENAPNDKSVYSGNAQRYLNMLRAAKTVCDGLGIKVADGGCTSASVMYLVYKYLPANEQAVFKKTYRYYPTERTKAAADFADSIFKYSPCDYLNFHWFQDTTITTALESIQSYLRSFGKEIMCNDIGTKSGDKEVMTAILKATKTYYTIIHSGGKNTLQNKDGSLNTLGQEVQKYINSQR